MREYKFRGKPIDKKAGNWMYGSLVFKRNGTPCIHFYDPNPQKFECIYEVDPETVGEYTGLKDKNGKEIYDGDIVPIDGYNGVVYRHECGDWRADKFILWEWIDKSKHVNEWEVIGNIYENPELLKGGDTVGEE
jgi:uncharacterized phage protein (TIGR01671 family)